MPSITEQIRKEAEQRKQHYIDGTMLPEAGLDLPKHKVLRVKQVRMTDEMIEQLYATARRLMDQRPEKTETLTASTVARLCIAYTLHRIDREGVMAALRGSTEEELLEAFQRHLS